MKKKKRVYVRESETYLDKGFSSSSPPSSIRERERVFCFYLKRKFNFSQLQSDPHFFIFTITLELRRVPSVSKIGHACLSRVLEVSEVRINNKKMDTPRGVSDTCPWSVRHHYVASRGVSVLPSYRWIKIFIIPIHPKNCGHSFRNKITTACSTKLCSICINTTANV